MIHHVIGLCVIAWSVSTNHAIHADHNECLPEDTKEDGPVAAEEPEDLKSFLTKDSEDPLLDLEEDIDDLDDFDEVSEAEDLEDSLWDLEEDLVVGSEQLFFFFLSGYILSIREGL